jgi:hypothetical protein
MTDPMSLPNRVVKADGRLEQFDGDRISRALFAATERVGRPDPFLARELTDGVLHFLTADGAADPIPIGDVIDATVKAVRELGQPVVARAFQDLQTIQPGDDPAMDLLPPDLRAAERDGLLRFFDADAPLKLAGMVLPPSGPRAEGGWIEAVAASRDRAGQYLAIDGPEFLLSTPAAAADWARALQVAVNASGLSAVVNLNVAEPPGWAATEGGPLFGPPQGEDAGRRREVAETIARGLLDVPENGIRVDWHLGEDDFDPAHSLHLIRLAEYVANNVPIAFVPDRPRRPISLGEGLDRDNPAVLAAVGVGLPRLLDKKVAGAKVPDTFLSRLGSLARLALSAGHVRRGALRRIGPPGISAGFLLDRARLLVIPLGLNDVVRSVTAQHGTAGAGLDFARDILLGLNAALLRDAARVPAVIGGMPPAPKLIEWSEDFDVPPQQQLRAAASLHTAIGSGTAIINLPAGPPPGPAEIADLLKIAWQQPGLDRFSFRPRKPRLRQMTAGW